MCGYLTGMTTMTCMTYLSFSPIFTMNLDHPLEIIFFLGRCKLKLLK